MLDKILFIFIVTNPLISSIIESTFDYYRISSIMIFLIITFQMLVKKRFHKYIFITGILFCFSFLFNLNNIYSFSKYSNHTIRLINCLLVFRYFTDKHILEKFFYYIKKNIRFINYMVNFIVILELLLLVTGLGWVYEWEDMYFRGLNLMPHTSAYLMICMIFISLILYEINPNKIKFINTLIFSGLITLTGARSVLFMLMIVWLTIIIKYKKVIKSTILSIITLIICKDYIKNIPIIKKFIRQLEYGDFMSGRDIITENMINSFNNFNFTGKSFGVGPDKTYYINLLTIGSDIWAHNDILQVLIGFGVMGVIIYIYTLVSSIFRLYYFGNKFNVILIAIGIIFLMVSNGFYSYNTIVLALPFMGVYLTINKLGQVKSMI